MHLTVFYHVWADGNWAEPLAEFLGALDQADFDGPLRLGIVGKLQGRRAVESAVTRDYEVAVVAPRGYEQVTLRAVHEFALRDSGAVLYGHTKGAWRDYPIQRPWRREVTTQVVGNWRKNLDVLEDHDVVGSSWQSWEPDPSGFLANFWLARCEYLRGLTPPVSRRRTESETWLGSNQPRVYDLAPRRMRWIPTDGRDVDGGRKIQVAPDQIAIMIAEEDQGVLAVQIVPSAWLPGATERMVWRILKPEEAQAWRESYALV